MHWVLTSRLGAHNQLRSPWTNRSSIWFVDTAKGIVVSLSEWFRLSCKTVSWLMNLVKLTQDPVDSAELCAAAQQIVMRS
jgi:hypothetical protein